MDTNEFGKSSGKYIEYFLYIEGVRVPFKSLSVMAAHDQGAILSADLMPLFSATRFLRGMLVHLFKRENDEQPRLRFFGLLRNIAYEKTDTSRSVRLEAGTPDSRWELLSFSEISEHSLTAGTNHELAYSGSDPAAIASANAVLASGGVANVISPTVSAMLSPTSSGTRQLSEKDIAASKWSTTDYFGLLMNNPKITQAQRDAVRWALESAEPLRVPISDMAEKVKQGISYIIPTAANWKFDSPELNALFKVMAWNNSKLGLLYVATKMQDALVQTIQAAKGDVLAGLMQVVVDAYLKSNEYNRLEFKRVKLDKAMVAMSTVMPNIENDIFRMATDFTLDDKLQKTRYGLYDLFGAIVSSSPATARLKDIVTNLTNAIFCHVAMDPTQIEHSIIFHPDMIGLFPPRCNVIFPNQIRSLTYNPNMWAEPTRSYVAYGSRSTLSRGTSDILVRNSSTPMDRAYICDSNDPDLQKLNVEKLVGEETPGGKAARFIALSQILSNEETAKGILCGYYTVASPILQRLDKGIGGIVANALHQRGKYGVRVCNVTCDLVDDLIVGMPIVVLDGTFSVYGKLSNMAYTIDTDGSVQTSLTISAPINVFSDTVPDPILWLKVDELHPARIGEIYKKLFGCDSIFSNETEPYDSWSPSKTLHAHVSHLLKTFEGAPDKRLYTDLYRARKFLTDQEVFQNYHKASPMSYSSKDQSIAYWYGDDFIPYKLGTPDQLTRDLMPHELVNRQERVIDFMKEYYGKPGRFEQ